VWGLGEDRLEGKCSQAGGLWGRLEFPRGGLGWEGGCGKRSKGRTDANEEKGGAGGHWKSQKCHSNTEALGDCHHLSLSEAAQCRWPSASVSYSLGYW
jgi:hypothetical protein